MTHIGYGTQWRVQNTKSAGTKCQDICWKQCEGDWQNRTPHLKLCMLVRVHQRDRTNKINLSTYLQLFLYSEIYYSELGQAITEAEKSQDLSSTSWRHRRAGDIVWRYQRQRAEVENSSSSWMAGNQEHWLQRHGSPAQGESKSSLVRPLCSTLAIKGLEDAYHIDEDSPYKFKYQCLLDSLTDTSRNNA